MYYQRALERLFGRVTLKVFSPSGVCQKPHGVGNTLDFPIFAFWKSKALMKVCFFAWTAIKGKIPIEIVLKDKKFQWPSRCGVCLEEEEMADHLLIYFCWASSVWHLSLSLMGVSWVQLSLVKDMVVALSRRTKNS